ncbi:hypothetical protein C0128_01205 [Moraxella catarrhalis]|nr:hypothetical protein E9W_05309 [Moraxella catarrhalis CO72]MPW56526.1 hypothetical protein [Moraxella catarrhalis]MPW60975.1 hypothetical protein [Moraxella catarrhalis]
MAFGIKYGCLKIRVWVSFLSKDLFDHLPSNKSLLSNHRLGHFDTNMDEIIKCYLIYTYVINKLLSRAGISKFK